MQTLFKQSLTAIYLCFLLSVHAWADRYVLFQPDGVVASNYDAIVANLRVGDVLVFSDGKEFTVQDPITNGNTTKILGISKHKVLRIPLRQGVCVGCPGTYTDILNSYLEGHEALVKEKVPTVHVYKKESLKNQRVIVDRVDVKFTLEEYVARENNRLNFTPAQYDSIDKKLIQWFETTWNFVFIGDFHAKQLVYDGKKWILIDFSGDHNLLKRLNDESIFLHVGDGTDVHSNAPRQLHHRIHSAIYNKRVAWRDSPKRCNTVFVHPDSGI